MRRERRPKTPGTGLKERQPAQNHESGRVFFPEPPPKGLPKAGHGGSDQTERVRPCRPTCLSTSINGLKVARKCSQHGDSSPAQTSRHRSQMTETQARKSSSKTEPQQRWHQAKQTAHHARPLATGPNMRGPTVTQIKVGALSQPPAASWDPPSHGNKEKDDVQAKCTTCGGTRARFEAAGRNAIQEKGQGTMHRPISSI